MPAFYIRYYFSIISPVICMNEFDHYARIFKALGDPNRLSILHTLQKKEKCGHDLLESLGIGQPTLSHHMKILCDSGIVIGEKKGKWVYYSISPEGMETVLDILHSICEPPDDSSGPSESISESIPGK